MNIGISILAFGKEHINECNNLINQLSIYPNLHFYITTNLPYSILGVDNLNIIYVEDEFNYNLKRVGFERALMENDCVIQMDSDIYIKGELNFKILNDIDDGMYLKFKRVYNEDMKLSSDIEYDYIKEIKLITKLDELFFIDESTLIFKITDKSKKESLINWWNKLYTKTLHLQPTYRYKGAVEGLLIYSGCVLSDIKVFEGLQPFMDNIYHYIKYGKLDLEKNII